MVDQVIEEYAMRILNYTVVLLLSLSVISGCQFSRETTQVADFERNSVSKYPPVSVILDRTEMRSTVAYTDMNDYLIKEFRDSRLFQLVDPFDADNPYTVNITVQEQYLDGGFELTMKNIVNIMSLLLIPINYELMYDATFQFEDKDGTLKVYKYSVQADQIGFISVDTRSSKAQASKLLVSKFLSDAQNDQLFKR